MASARVATITFLALSAAFSGAQSGSWISENLMKRIVITGHRELAYHLQKVDGDRQAFRDLTYSGRGGRRFTDTGQMTIDGHDVLGVLNFQMQISDNRYQDPESQRISINYKKGPYSLDLGDIRGSLLNTNSLASFNRSLKGTAIGYKSGRLAMKAVRSQAKGSATTISIAGENSVGPYFLQSGRIVKDSVQIQVDGQDLKLGQDYSVNYDIGSVTFINKIIPPTSTMVVTYESLGLNGSLGTVEGVGASYDFGKFGKVGLTSLQQKPTGVLGVSERTDLFQGFGDPSTPYFLSYEPLRTRPVIVKLQGIIQTEGVHYRFDTENPAVFYFLFHVPSTSNVDVTYTPKPIQTVDGNRKVFGFDYTLPLGRNGLISYNQARGSLESEVTPMSGTARKLQASYNVGSLRLQAGFTDVPNTFVGVQTTGFLRNEKSSSFALDNSTGHLGYGLSMTNGLIGSRSIDNGGKTVFQNARATNATAYLKYAQNSNTSWQLQHVRNTSASSLGETRLDTTSLTNSWKRGRLNTSFGYDRTLGRAPLSGSGVTSLGLDTLKLSATYDAGAAWSLGGNVGLSNIHTSEKDGHGNDISFFAGYKPSSRLSVDFNTSQSNSGALAALAGFQNGYGIGYGGNGFSSGVSGSGLAGSAGTDYRSTTLEVTYQLTPKINLSSHLMAGRSSGSVSANSESRAMSLDVDWDMGKGNTTGLSVSRSHTAFLQTDNKSDATTLDWFVVGNPQGLWSYRLGLNTLITGGQTLYGQNSFGVDGSLSRRINPHQNLGFAFHTGRTTGYLPQSDSFFTAFHEYQLYQNIALRTSYTWRKLLNNDPTITTGAYQAHGLDLQLTFDFVP